MGKDSSKGMAEEALFSGAAWFDPIEAGLRGRIRGLIEELVEQELEAALAGGATSGPAGPLGIGTGTASGNSPARSVRSNSRCRGPGYGPRTAAAGNGAAPCCRATPGGHASSRR
jgi:hypothetical protein